MWLKKSKKILIIYLLIIAIIGAIFLYFIWLNSLNVIKEQALTLAMTSEAGFQMDNVKKLEAVPNDIEKLEYDYVKKSLMKLVNINQNVRFAYMYKMKDQKIYFMVDSEPETSEDYSPPGQVYNEATEESFQSFRQENPMITSPITDRWGSWISILVPMKDARTGETIAVFGMDYPVDIWAKDAIKRTMQAGLLVSCLIALFITIYIVLDKNKALKYEKSKLAVLNERLSEKEELFRTIFEQSPIGISFGNYGNSMTNTNSKFEQIIGRPKEELNGKTWMDITHPDDIQKDIDFFEKLQSGEIDTYTLEKRYIKPNNSIVWARMTIAPLKITNHNKIDDISYMCIVEDISERIQAVLDLQESERSNAMLLSNLPGMAYRCNYDKEWTMQFVSEGCYDLTGYRPESLIHNKEISFSDIIAPDCRDILWKKWTQILKERKVFKEEFPIITSSGKTKWVFEQGQGVYDENGEVKVIEGLIIDISDRKQREDEIRYLNHHDVLTGLYNRRYFEEEKIRFDCESYYPLSVIIGDINGLKLFNDALGHAEGDKLIESTAEILMKCCREGDVIARTGGDEFSILLPKTKKEDANKIIRQIGKICEKYKLKIMKESYHISISLGCSTKTNSEELLNDIIKEAEDSMYRHKLLQNKSLHSSIISSMKSALFAKSQHTEEHAQRLIDLSKAIGKSMGLTDVQLNELELLSTLHDIGKIGISDNILNKPGKLTEEEWSDMKKHPEIGFRIAMSTPDLVPIAEYILSHHEHWDGNGYPQGMKGEDIPLLSRIIAIADAYDAMTEDRPYRSAMTKEEAIAELENNSGSQFDPRIATLFLNILKNSNKIS